MKAKIETLVLGSALLALFLCVQAGMIACDVIDKLRGFKKPA